VTEIEVTECDKCNIELEIGQVGLCEDCREYAFDELDEKAKDNARDAERYSEGYMHDEWWDGVYEDAAFTAALLGFDIDTNQVKLMNGKSCNDPCIEFSGFSSQGDGACFRGQYRYNIEAIERIAEHAPNDAELLRIATELTAMQLNQRVKGLEWFSASITTSSNYSHSGTMRAEIIDYGIDEIGEVNEDQFIQLVRDFADWIYGQLEQEHDYQMSDEIVDEHLRSNEIKFDSSGTEV
jgi:hypothetical protein